MGTHATNITGRVRIRTTALAPTTAHIGDEYWDSTDKALKRWSGSQWLTSGSWTTTSTSTSTTTSTSTSTTTTTTSTSTTTTTSTSTSTTTTG